MTDRLTPPVADLQAVLTHGLLAGYWSVNQFNARQPPGAAPVIPTWAFLDQHPQFADSNFRDLDAFRIAGHRGNPL